MRGRMAGKSGQPPTPAATAGADTAKEVEERKALKTGGANTKKARRQPKPDRATRAKKRKRTQKKPTSEKNITSGAKNKKRPESNPNPTEPPGPERQRSSIQGGVIEKSRGRTPQEKPESRKPSKPAARKAKKGPKAAQTRRSHQGQSEKEAKDKEGPSRIAGGGNQKMRGRPAPRENGGRKTRLRQNWAHAADLWRAGTQEAAARSAAAPIRGQRRH